MEGETTAEVPFVFEAPKYTDLEHDEANEQYDDPWFHHFHAHHEVDGWQPMPLSPTAQKHGDYDVVMTEYQECVQKLQASIGNSVVTRRRSAEAAALKPEPLPAKQTATTSTAPATKTGVIRKSLAPPPRKSLAMTKAAVPVKPTPASSASRKSIGTSLVKKPVTATSTTMSARKSLAPAKPTTSTDVRRKTMAPSSESFPSFTLNATTLAAHTANEGLFKRSASSASLVSLSSISTCTDVSALSDISLRSARKSMGPTSRPSTARMSTAPAPKPATMSRKSLAPSSNLTRPTAASARKSIGTALSSARPATASLTARKSLAPTPRVATTASAVMPVAQPAESTTSKPLETSTRVIPNLNTSLSTFSTSNSASVRKSLAPSLTTPRTSTITPRSSTAATTTGALASARKSLAPSTARKSLAPSSFAAAKPAVPSRKSLAPARPTSAITPRSTSTTSTFSTARKSLAPSRPSTASVQAAAPAAPTAPVAVSALGKRSSLDTSEAGDTKRRRTLEGQEAGTAEITEAVADIEVVKTVPTPKAASVRPTTAPANKSVTGRASVVPRPASRLSSVKNKENAVRPAAVVVSAAGRPFAERSTNAKAVVIEASDAKKRTLTQRGDDMLEGMDDLASMLAQHNKKVKPQSLYVAPEHSVKEIRLWEKETGSKWHDLNAAQRQAANEAIAQRKREQAALGVA